MEIRIMSLVDYIAEFHNNCVSSFSKFYGVTGKKINYWQCSGYGVIVCDDFIEIIKTVDKFNKRKQRKQSVICFDEREGR